MRILVTNDDGYAALGIRVLARVAARLGDVRIVAPDREQSATSHSLTMHRPLRVRRLDDVLVVDGTPTDCVVLALGELLDERPDLVVSGVNHGPNLGDDVLYSGTVAAAMEATILGIPAVAISYAGRNAGDALEAWEDRIHAILSQIADKDRFPSETLINVNLPPVPPDETRGVRITTLGRRAYIDSLTRARDPSGREYFWIGGGESRWWGAETSDFHAVRDGYISVTPLHLDLTDYRLIEDLNRWDLKP